MTKIDFFTDIHKTDFVLLLLKCQTLQGKQNTRVVNHINKSFDKSYVLSL